MADAKEGFSSFSPIYPHRLVSRTDPGEMVAITRPPFELLVAIAGE
jgi:hypothetical protein